MSIPTGSAGGDVSGAGWSIEWLLVGLARDSGTMPWNFLTLLTCALVILLL